MPGHEDKERNRREWREEQERRRLAAKLEASRARNPNSEESAPTGTYTFPFPTRYLEFLAHIGVSATGPQADLFGVACDGQNPAETEHGPALFGPVTSLSDRARRRVCIVKGRRAGGTYLCALRGLHLALTLPLPTLADGEFAFCYFVGPDLETAKQAMRFAHGAASANHVMAAMMTGADTSTEFDLVRPDGTVRMQCRAANKGGVGVRSRTTLFAHYTEYGYFRGESNVVNDADMRRAVEPSIVSGGQLFLESTPWVASGELYEFHREEYGKPQHTLVVEAPTALMRPDDANLLALVAEAYEKDPDDAAREYGAKFTSSDASLFFEPNALEAAIADGQWGMAPKPGTDAAGGGDFGFTRNSSALAVTHRTAGVLSLADLLELKPEPGKPLKPSETVGEFAATLKLHGLRALTADQHHRESIREHLGNAGLRFVDAPTQPAVAFMQTRALLNEGKLRLVRPGNPDERRVFALLLSQLREVRSRKLPGGGVAMVLPKSPDGRHGDLAAAYVLAVYSRAAVRSVEAGPPRGSPEWQELEARKWERTAEDRIKRETSGDFFGGGIHDEGKFFDD